MVKEWGYGCGELADLMHLYVEYHLDSQYWDRVIKIGINHKIANISVVSSTNINSTAIVGWFYKESSGKECVIPEHQEGWYLRIELKEPIWVYTCMGIQLHLEKDVIRMVSDRGCSYNVAQNVNFHLNPVPCPKEKKNSFRMHFNQARYTIAIHKNHPKDFNPIIDENTPTALKTPLSLIPIVTLTHKEGDIYTVRLQIKDRDTLELLKLGIYRLGKSTDRVRQYCKRKDTLNPPEWFAASSDHVVVENDTAITYDINLSEIKDALEEYELRFYLPNVLIKKYCNTYLHRNTNFVLDLGNQETSITK